MVDYLLAQGHDVHVLDNLQTGALINLEHLQGNDKFHFHKHDIIEPWTPPEGVKFDQIYHMACAASPPFYQAVPIHTLLTSVYGCNNMLQLALKDNARILFSSTSEVYGDPDIHPQREDYWGHVNCTGIRSCYDEGKRAGETLCFDYHRVHKVQVRVARIFNTYGPRMNLKDGRIISNFVFQSLTNTPLTVFGDGSQTRSFCYVSDLIEGLVRLMNNEETIGPVNIGNPEEHTVLEMAERIRNVIGPNDSNKLTFEGLPSDDPKKRKPDITLAKKYLNWEPTVSLEEGLRRTIADFSKRVKQQ
jgi:UDP-glucuronate decarboxylase